MTLYLSTLTRTPTAGEAASGHGGPDAAGTGTNKTVKARLWPFLQLFFRLSVL